jgi:shikimate dehydrogenase
VGEVQKIVAFFGDPAKAPLLAAMHNAAFPATGLKWAYIPFRADATTLPALFARLIGDGLAGADFADPCEEAAIALCDELSDEAKLLAAANTARVSVEGVCGYNVDAYAFARTLGELGLEVARKAALILGTGAVARACGLALERAGAAVTYAAADLTRPRPGVSTRATVVTWSDAQRFLTERKPAALVDATPAGSVADGPAPFDYDVIPPGCLVYDLNCGRPTSLLKAAEDRGLRAADGLSMLIYKAARAFEFWTGAEPPLDVMRRAAAVELEKRNA